jgi:hypothetical protein
MLLMGKHSGTESERWGFATARSHREMTVMDAVKNVLGFEK